MRINPQKSERKHHSKKIDLAISWLNYLLSETESDNLQLDCEEIKGIKEAIKYLNSIRNTVDNRISI